MTKSRLVLPRRALLKGATAGLLVPMLAARRSPAQTVSGRPELPNGVQSGDVTGDRAVVWARADRPAQMIVDYATTESMADSRRVLGPAALVDNDFTAKVALRHLPAGQTVFYRVTFQDLADTDVRSEPAAGRFRTAAVKGSDISFVWSGDTAGQGWGINEEWGGMRAYATMRGHEPDFFIHSGDTIYADGPLKAEVPLEDGTVWKNVMIPEKEKVAETLAEFRGNFRYNLMDANLRRMSAEVPLLAQWDDHETVNNWYPGEMLLDREDYTVKSASLLAARARQAFFEYMPIRVDPSGRMRIHRTIRRGPALDVFFLDMRSFRGPNGPNVAALPGPETAFLGTDQLAWLKRRLLTSRATWKVIAADMPIGILVRDGDAAFENGANGNGPALGRELEIASLLRFIRDNAIRNVVWLTADVHYTAAHRYDPAQARFREFAPFWEFVSGPLNAGTFGPGEMDDTFGPEVVFAKSADGVPNLPPSDGLQFFGHIRIDGDSEVMTVTLRDIADIALWSTDIEPER